MKHIHPYFRPSIQILYSDSVNAQVLITPIEKGFSNPFANLLRKIMYKYTPGTGIIGMSLDGYTHIHPYLKMPGSTEDVSFLLNNLRNLHFQIFPYSPVVFKLKKKGPSVVTISDLHCPSNVKILTPELNLCTLHDTSELSLTLFGDIGYGFIPSHYFGLRNNILYSDTVFCPIKHVSYYTRSYTTYEELIMYVKTNGVCDPISALKNAFSFLSDKIHIQNWI